MMKIRNNIREEMLYEVWESFCLSGSYTKDKRLRGIYAGKLNKFDGPDFQGAEFEFEGKIYRGDIEVHRSQKDWYLHGHHLDSRYDGVVLHLTWFLNEDNNFSIKNSKHLSIPTLSLQNIPVHLIDKFSSNHCALPKDKRIFFNNALKKQALMRLLNKANNISSFIIEYGYDQGMFIFLMQMLGIPNNKNNFERLANLITWDRIQKLKQRYHLAIEGWIAFFLIQSGLIGKKNEYRFFKQYFKNLPQILIQPPMSADVWKLAGQRPNNNPINRIKGLAFFIHNFPAASLYQIFSELFYKRDQFNQIYNKLYRLMSPAIKTNLIKPKFDHFWGRSLIIELIGNVFIPFFYNEALRNKSFGFADYLEEFFLYLPATSSYAILNPYYKWPELDLSKFYINQALLSLHNNYCLVKSCKHCPAGRVAEIH